MNRRVGHPPARFLGADVPAGAAPVAGNTPAAGDAAGGAPGGRMWTIVRWISLTIIVLGLVSLGRSLPVGRLLPALQEWIAGFGALGWIAFGVIYVLAGLLLVPGAALTIAAGALFGLAAGTAVVSIASTITAALAFLIARYLARAQVERAARSRPKFAAVDHAIGEGGWKVVALLRLSPLIPFSAGNYLYGLTKVRFWPCVLASWAAMLPGTFLYVYLGHAGGLAAAGDGGGDAGRSPCQWALLGASLAATVAVTWYISRLARRVLAGHADLGREAEAGRRAGEVPAAGRGGAPVLTALAVLTAGLATGAHLFRDRLAELMSAPPDVTMREAYERKPGGPVFDHGALDALLRDHVSEGGWVDYAALKRDPVRLDRYLALLKDVPVDDLGRDERLALLINAYNAFTLRLIVDHHPIGSIKDIPASKRWEDRRWRLGGGTFSLNQIEHELIRPRFAEPRIHFALVCAAVGCPPLRREAYTGARLEEQLQDQAREVHAGDRWLRIVPGGGEVRLTSLYEWYASDFEQFAPSALDYAARHAPELDLLLRSGARPEVSFLDYDWRLNSLENRP